MTITIYANPCGFESIRTCVVGSNVICDFGWVARRAEQDYWASGVEAEHPSMAWI